MKICIYGAGGPVAAAGIDWLAADHELRLTDVNPMETSHEFVPVDITAPDQVTAAAAGMDVLINTTVIRKDPVVAFDVNHRGAYNVMQAAVTQGVPRVIHTGPGFHLGVPGGYLDDFDVTEECPPRPGADLYAMSKYLGYVTIETFCAQHPELCVITFFYSGFYSDEPGGGGWTPTFAIDARDAGQAFKLGVEVPRERLATNCELFNISADLPQERVSNAKAKRVLGWQPEHNFEQVWSKSARRQWLAEHPEG